MPFNLYHHLRCAWRYDRLLTPYVDGELDEGARARLHAHLAQCGRCRAAVEEQRFAADLLAKLMLPASPETAPPFAAARVAQFPSWRAADAPRARRLLTPLRISAAVLFAIAAFWCYNRLQSSTWEVISLAGTPTINAASITESGALAVGEVLETGPTARARITIGRIGHVDVEPNSRLRLASTKLTDQRLTLERGRLQAVISAPPRIFFVDTPSAQAVDLGCAYTLEADAAGKGLLQVTAGWVAFVLDRFELKVPAGAACQTRPEVGPGTPFFVDATAALQSDLQKLDFEKGSDTERQAALDRLLNEARPRDTLTLFYLLRQLTTDQRAKVYDKLAAYVAPPDGVSKEGVLQLDGKMLDDYRQTLEPTWLQESVPQLRRLWRWMWS